MIGPMKTGGLTQGLFETSSTRKEMIGSIYIDRIGRSFAYSRASTSALSAGKLGMAAAMAAHHVDATFSKAAAIGDTVVSLTVSAGTAIAADALNGGFLQVNDGTGEGHQYLIESNSAISASGTAMVLTLAEPIRVAMTATSATEVSLVHSPWYGVSETATEENVPVGIALVAVPASYYYWAQTGGVACVLSTGSDAVATMMIPGATAGGVADMNSTLDVDQPVIGLQFGTAGVSGEYKPIVLKIR